MVSGTSGDVIQPPPGWTGAPADSASRHGEEEVRARGWRCRRSACAVQAGYDHAGILRRLAGSAHLFVAGAAPCARGRPPTRWSPRAGRRAHRAPSSRLHPRALATARAYQRLARPMPVAAAAARSAIVGYRRVRHVVVVRGLRVVSGSMITVSGTGSVGARSVGRAKADRPTELRASDLTCSNSEWE